MQTQQMRMYNYFLTVGLKDDGETSKTMDC